MGTLALARNLPVTDVPPLVIERFLRDRDGVWRQIDQEYRLNALLAQMLIHSAVALGCYGAVLGASHSILQALASAIKLPVLFLLTLAICLPTLYVSNLLLGGRLSARQVLALLLSAITITSVFTMAFAPISFFFLVTAQSYPFFVLLNVAILTITSAVGLQFLLSGVRHLNGLVPEERQDQHPDKAESQLPPPRTLKERPTRPAHWWLFQVWLWLYAFVGTQLGWTLRPFFGTPGAPFQLFRELEGSFYESILRLLAQVMN